MTSAYCHSEGAVATEESRRLFFKASAFQSLDRYVDLRSPHDDRVIKAFHHESIEMSNPHHGDKEMSMSPYDDIFYAVIQKEYIPPIIQKKRPSHHSDRAKRGKNPL
tara:strand:- start:4692 stop:5012 length:321 start_codon:yes stop_codon:yes gene_type:complete